MNAAAVPHLRGSGRTREAPYGVPEALLATAVVVLLAMVWCWMLPDAVWRGVPATLSRPALDVLEGVDSSVATPVGRAYTVSVLFVFQLALLLSIWARRRPRVTAAPMGRVSELPALVTLLLGLAVLLLIPACLVLGGGGNRPGPAFLLGSMAITGIALVFLANSRLPRSRRLRRRGGDPTSAEGDPPHVHGGLATPASALAALGDRAPGISFQGFRARAAPQAPGPVGFSLTHVPDRTLVPGVMGVVLLAILSVLVGLPAIALVFRTLS